jgi:FMN reductase
MTEVLREAAVPNMIGDRPMRVVGASGSMHEPSGTTASDLSTRSLNSF